ncbi:hypothetical protein LMG18090_00988 [Ralstonia mannitolilytica]|nr:hypothetical protein LMG18090_00988 [Ralstonia mannitolilytica]
MCEMQCNKTGRVRWNFRTATQSDFRIKGYPASHICVSDQ